MMIDLKKAAENYGGQPYLNEPYVITQQNLYIQTHPTTFADIEYWVERTPEAIAIISAISTDILSDGIAFESIGKTDKGVKVKRAKDFYEKHRIKETMRRMMHDWLTYGDCYGWIGGLEKAQESREFAAYKAVRELPVEQKTDTFNALVKASPDILEEEAFRLVKHVPAIQMDILHDTVEITGYKQILHGGKIRVWTPKEIINIRLMTLKGKVYGFSPFQASLVEMQTIGYVKDYASSFFKKGGVPDWMFILMKEQAGSANHKRLVQELQTHKHPAHKHGSMVLTGEVEAKPIGAMSNKDMEFRQTLIQMVGSLAIGFNMPVYRILQVMGKDVKAGEGADLADSAYWRKISFEQDNWEQVWNQQFWIPYFGVKMKFNRSYLQDEVRETTVMQQKVGIITAMKNQIGLQLTTDYIKKYLNLDDDDLESDKLITAFDKQQAAMGSQGTRQQLSNAEVQPGQANQSMREKKKKEQQQHQENDEKNPGL